MVTSGSLPEQYGTAGWWVAIKAAPKGNSVVGRSRERVQGSRGPSSIIWEIESLKFEWLPKNERPLTGAICYKTGYTALYILVCYPAVPSPLYVHLSISAHMLSEV